MIPLHKVRSPAKKKRSLAANGVGKPQLPAELALALSPAEVRRLVGESDVQRLYQELKVHQIELELQNEELRNSKAETEALLERYTDLYDFAPVGYFNLTADSRIQLVNLAGASMFATERAHLVGRSFTSLVTPSSRPAFKRLLLKVFSDRIKHSADIEILHAGASIRTVNIEARCLFSGLECRVVVVDITERKRSADRLQLLWESARVLLASDDPDTMLRGLFAKIGPSLGVEACFNYLVDKNGPGLRLASFMGVPESRVRSLAQLAFGQAFCGTVAQTREPVHATHLQTSTDPKARLIKSLGLRAYACSPLLNGKTLIGTLAFASRSKDRFDPGELAVLQTLTHYVAVAHERQQGALSLRASEARYRRLLEAAHDGVLLLDPATSRITDANPFMTKLLNCPHARLVGKKLHEIGLLKDATAGKAMLGRLKKDHAVRYDHLPLARRRGRRLQVEVVANLYQENGRPVIQCNIRDITERIQNEQARRALDILTASNAKLKKEIVRRKAVELSLTTSERRALKHLEQARQLQEKLRRLSRQMLMVQEEQRKKISRELHDDISQLLVGIIVHVANFTKAATVDPACIQKKLTPLRLMVEKAVRVVHRFARDLRPTMLDDLGLIPALQAHIEELPEHRGRRVKFTAFEGAESLDNERRTVLYRVAQEALVNVSKHARATAVNVVLSKSAKTVRLEIADNGRAFDVNRLASPEWKDHLGLVGMRERVEMVGGSLEIVSARGKGTTITASVPVTGRPARRKRQA